MMKNLEVAQDVAQKILKDVKMATAWFALPLLHVVMGSAIVDTAWNATGGLVGMNVTHAQVMIDNNLHT